MLANTDKTGPAAKIKLSGKNLQAGICEVLFVQSQLQGM